jgi:hypothetical protein
MSYFFLLTEDNVKFAALLNGGVVPSVLDKDGNNQYFVVYDDGRPNEIHKWSAPLEIRLSGTNVVFEPQEP